MKRGKIGILLLCAAWICSGCAYVPGTEQSSESTALYSGRDKRQLYQAIYEAASNFREHVSVSGEPESSLISEICQQINADHPEIFWFSGWSASSTDGSVTDIQLKIPPQSEQHECKYRYQQLLDAAEAIRKDIPEHASDYEKALTVHDYLTAHTRYDAQAEHGADAYGCLVEHTAFCEGYSRAFLLLMNQLEIPAGLSSGMASGVGHMWNYIQLDGDYYWVDVTWDDTRIEGADDEQCNHYYCFINDDLLMQSHSLGSGQLYIPECNSMKMNYFMQNGLYLEQYDYEAVRAVIETQLQQGKNPVELMFDSKASYDAALHDLFDENNIWTFDSVPADSDGCVYSGCENPFVLRIDLTSSGEPADAEPTESEAPVNDAA